jgi:hypothetical protein
MTKTVVIEKYFFGICYHRYSYTETITPDEKERCEPLPKKASIHLARANEKIDELESRPRVVATKHNLEG